LNACQLKSSIDSSTSIPVIAKTWSTLFPLSKCMSLVVMIILLPEPNHSRLPHKAFNCCNLFTSSSIRSILLWRSLSLNMIFPYSMLCIFVLCSFWISNRSCCCKQTWPASCPQTSLISARKLLP